MNASEMHPAVRRAQVLARFDRLPQAIQELESACRAEPDNEPLRRELADLRQQRQQMSIPGGVRHQCVGWLCLLGAMTIAFGPLFLLLRFAQATSFVAAPDGTTVALLAIAFLIALVLLMLCAIRLFLHSWFAYLGALAPTERRIAEGHLAVVLNLPAFEPQYSRMRAMKFGLDDEHSWTGSHG